MVKLEKSLILEELLVEGPDITEDRVFELFGKENIRKVNEFFVSKDNNVIFAYSKKGIVIFDKNSTLFSEYNGDFTIHSLIQKKIYMGTNEKPELRSFKDNNVIINFEDFNFYTNKNEIVLTNGIYECFGISAIKVEEKNKIITISDTVTNNYDYFEKLKITKTGICLPEQVSPKMNRELKKLLKHNIISDTTSLLNEFNNIQNEKDFEILKEKINKYQDMLMLCGDDDFVYLIESLDSLNLIAEKVKLIIKTANTNKCSLEESVLYNKSFINKVDKINSYDLDKLGKYYITNSNLNEIETTFIKFRKEIENNLLTFNKTKNKIMNQNK